MVWLIWFLGLSCGGCADLIVGLVWLVFVSPGTLFCVVCVLWVSRFELLWVVGFGGLLLWCFCWFRWIWSRVSDFALFGDFGGLILLELLFCCFVWSFLVVGISVLALAVLIWWI